MSVDFRDPRAQPFSLGEGKAACLMVHGFTGSPGHLRPMGEALARQGLHAEGILLGGHCTTLQDMELHTWRDWYYDVRDALLSLRNRYDRVAALGLSMGGLLALIMAEEQLCDAVVSISSPMRIFSALPAFFAPILWPFIRYSNWVEVKRENYLSEYDFGYNATPVRRVADLNHLMRLAERELDKISCPLMVVQSKKDETVRPVSGEIINRGAVNAANRTLMVLEESSHVCTLGPERKKLFAAASDFLCGTLYR